MWNNCEPAIVLEFCCLFFRTSCGVGVLNSAIFNSFHSRAEFGMILGGLRNFGGGRGFWTTQTPPPHSVRHWTAAIYFSKTTVITVSCAVIINKTNHKTLFPFPPKKIKFLYEVCYIFYVIRDDEIRHFNSYDKKCYAVLLLVAAVYDDVAAQCYRYRCRRSVLQVPM